jgi:hypothetical protein
VSGQLHAPAALPPGKSPQYPLYRTLGGPQSQSGRCEEEKILEPTGTRTLDPSVVQPVASRYTNYAILAPVSTYIYIKIILNRSSSTIHQLVRKYLSERNPLYAMLTSNASSQDSSTGIVMGYRLDGQCSIPCRGKTSLFSTAS